MFRWAAPLQHCSVIIKSGEDKRSEPETRAPALEDSRRTQGKGMTRPKAMVRAHSGLQAGTDRQ